MVIDDMVRLAKEVPAELLANGNKERALHIAGVKEASKETQKEWEDERRAKIEAKQTKTIDDLLSTLNKASVIIPHPWFKSWSPEPGDAFSDPQFNRLISNFES